MSGGSGGIGGLPPSPAIDCQQELVGECLTQSHSATGWCSATTGDPVILIVTIACEEGIPGDPVITVIDANTGAILPPGDVVQCSGRDWEVNQLCDVAATGVVIATVTEIFEWNEATGVLVRRLERADTPGVPYVPVGTLMTCSSGQLEAVTEIVCRTTLAGVSDQIIEVVLVDTLNGVVMSHYYLDTAGAVVVPAGTDTLILGPCGTRITEEVGCFGGAHVLIRTRHFLNGTQTTDIVNAAGALVPGATLANTRVGDCETQDDIDDISVSLIGIGIGIGDLGTCCAAQNALLGTIILRLDTIITHVDGLEGLITATNAALTTVNAHLTAIEAYAQFIALGYHAEDAAHTSGHSGVMALAVRNDTGAVTTSADGDYSQISVDSAGRILTVAQKTEDSPHVSGDAGTFTLAVRNDADAVRTSADGDYSPISVDSAGRVKVTGTVATTDTPAATIGGHNQISIGTGAASNLPAQAAVKGVIVKAVSTNAGIIYVGNSSGVTTATGFPLGAGEFLVIPVDNSSDVWARADTAAQNLAWMAV